MQRHIQNIFIHIYTCVFERVYSFSMHRIAAHYRPYAHILFRPGTTHEDIFILYISPLKTTTSTTTTRVTVALPHQSRYKTPRKRRRRFRPGRRVHNRHDDTERRIVIYIYMCMCACGCVCVVCSTYIHKCNTTFCCKLY